MLIIDSYEAVYQSPGDSLPVLGTMGLSNEDLMKLWAWLEDDTNDLNYENPKKSKYSSKKSISGDFYKKHQEDSETLQQNKQQDNSLEKKLDDLLERKIDKIIERKIDKMIEKKVDDSLEKLM